MIDSGHQLQSSNRDLHDHALAQDASLVQLPWDFAQAEQPRSWSYAFRPLGDLATGLDDAQLALLTAAVMALLHRYAQQCELELDLFVHDDRERPWTRALRFEIEAEQSFASVVARAADALASAPALLGARSNVGLSFARRGAEFDAASDFGGCSPQHDLHFLVQEGEDRVGLIVAYDAARLLAATVERMMDGLLLLLRAALLDGESKLYSLPVVTSAEARAIERLCEGEVIARSHEPLHVRFERIARAQPSAPAVRFQGQELSYGELDQRAEGLAAYLVASGVRPESRVAMCLAPCPEVVVAMLAIFKAGGVYVPLDPSHPPALLALILEEAKPVLVLTDARSQAALPEASARFLVDRDWHLLDASPARPLPTVHIDQPCYVLYTSGTTGRPKGVVATHKNLAHYLAVARERYGFGAADVFCSLARYTFSISFFELLSPLGCGGELRLLSRDDVLDPARLAAALAEVTVVHAGPSLLGSLFRHLRAQSAAGATLPNVRHASSGGDMVSPQLQREMARVFSAAEIFVIYGCTEISCMGVTYAVDRAAPPARNLVGKPFSGVAVRVLDAHGGLVPFGVVGEIHFAGDGIARRYLERPALTSEKFICRDGRRFYRTGDLGRLHADGNLEILGRRDFQVQLRGIRVELAGIEQTIRELGLASDAAVVAAARSEHDVRLVAFVVQPRECEASAFRRALAARLPDYMVPHGLIVLDALPLSANGKLDRRQLGELALAAPREPLAPRAQEAPRSSSERAIAEAFAAVLGLAEVGLDDDFFDLGGHSLTAVLLLEQLQNRLGLSLSPGLLFEHPSVRALAAAAAAAPTEQRPILLSERDDKPALFLLLGVQLYRELARELEGQYAVYGVYASSELNLLDGEHAPSVAALAAEYVTLIRRQQPSGPYRIGGMSFGGIVAYEVAQQLERAGEEVEALVLFDSVLPEPRLAKLRRWAGLSAGVLARELTERMRARWSGAGGGVSSEFLKHQDDAALRPLEERRQAAYRSAAEAYRPGMRPFQGPVTLFVAGKRLGKDRLQDARCGFGSLVANLTVHTVAAEHLELLAASAASDVAAHVARDLRFANGRRCMVPERPVALHWKLA